MTASSRNVWLAQGGLEHFRAFMNEGSFIPEGYNLPTVTPPSWATICTGAYPRTHGVEDYYYYHEGRSLDYKETTQAFGSDIVTAETIWDAWDKNGKKCIVVNYPMSWPSRMKNGVMIMGQGLSPAETRWPLHGNEHKEFLASESVISTEFYPMGVQGTFDDAKGWKNLPECDEPLEMVVNMAFKECVEPVEGQTWYCLAWESGDDGYDRIALCPEKDYSKAFFTIRLGEWSEPVQHDFTIKADGRTEKGVFRCKLMQLSDDAEEFKLYISGIAGRIGFIAPPRQPIRLTFPSTSPRTTSGWWPSCTASSTPIPCASSWSSTAHGSGTPSSPCSRPTRTGICSTCTRTPSTGSITAG